MDILESFENDKKYLGERYKEMVTMKLLIEAGLEETDCFSPIVSLETLTDTMKCLRIYLSVIELVIKEIKEAQDEE